MKVTYKSVSKASFHHCKGPEIPKVLLHGPTGISVVALKKLEFFYFDLQDY